MFKIGDRVQVKSYIGLFGGAKGTICEIRLPIIVVQFDINSQSSLNNRKVEMSVAELLALQENTIVGETKNNPDCKSYTLHSNQIYNKDLKMPKGWIISNFRPVQNGDYYLDAITGEVKLAENVHGTFVRLIVSRIYKTL